MRIARMLSPVHSLGPGNRVCIWTQGCSKNCKGCISPEMQVISGSNFDNGILSNIIVSVAEKDECSGLTISGGDPFEQVDELYDFLGRIRKNFINILVYTGFTMDEIRNGIAGEIAIKCLDMIDVLIDGRYVDEENYPDCVLRGSRNQNIWYLNENCRDTYEDYMRKGRILETFIHEKTTIVTGIFDRVCGESEEQ